MLGAVKRFLPDEGFFDAAIRGGALAGEEGHRGHHHAADRRRDEDVRRACRRRSSSCRTWSSTCCSGSGFNDAFRIFADHVRERYDAEPGFITMNLPLLLDVLDEVGHREPDRLLQHQQDRLPHVRRHRGLRAGAARARVPRDRDVGLRLRGDPGRRRRSSGSARSRTSSRSSSAPRAARNIRDTRELVDRVLASSVTTLLVASTGGHLKQLHRLHRRLAGVDGPVPLGHLRHPAEPLAARRRGGRLRPLRRRPRPGQRRPQPARSRGGSCATHEVDTIVSTGSAVALPFFALGRARRLRCHYIESAARSEGPSLTGAADRPDPGRPPLRPVPGLGRRALAASAARSSTPSRGAERRAARRRELRKVVVTLGTYQGLRLRAAGPAPARDPAARGRGALADRRHRRHRARRSTATTRSPSAS